MAKVTKTTTQKTTTQKTTTQKTKAVKAKDPHNKRVIVTIARRGDGTCLIYLNKFLSKDEFKAIVRPVIVKLGISQYKCCGDIQKLDKLPGHIITIDYDNNSLVKDLRKVDVEAIDASRVEVRRRNLDVIDRFIKQYAADPGKVSILGTPLKDKLEAAAKKAANA